MAAIDVLDPAARGTLWSILSHVAGGRSAGPDERDALRGARIALGLPSVSADDALPLDDLSSDELGPRERQLIYCAAAWMALADGIRVREESVRLEDLRARLRLGAATARFLDRQARWVRTSTGDMHPAGELDLLLTEVAKRLAMVEARLAA